MPEFRRLSRGQYGTFLRMIFCDAHDTLRAWHQTRVVPVNSDYMPRRRVVGQRRASVLGRFSAA